MSGTYVTKVNGNFIAASEVMPNSPLASKLASLISGTFEVVSLNQSGKPDVANPSTKIIYLTKSSTAGLTDPYTEWIYTGTDGEAAVASKWEIIGETTMDLSGYKTKQSAYTATGLGTLKTITALSQNANGEISATAGDIQSASTSQKGVVQLTNSTSSTSTTTAATPSSVKAAYDLANGKYTKPGTGIPKSDLESAAQTSLGKADTAIQGVILGGSSTELTPDSDKKVTIPVVSTSGTGEFGLMSPADKTKLDTLKEITVTSTSVSDGTTTFNKYTHPTSAGNKHVPSGGSSGQVLIYGGSSGTASWGAVPGISDKADKVSNATSGNFAALNANGNLTDSGKKASDFATSAQGTKADSAVQDVTVNGTSVVNASTKVAAISVASASVYGVVTVETETI